jgi:hypothetical protein
VINTRVPGGTEDSERSESKVVVVYSRNLSLYVLNPTGEIRLLVDW